MKVLSHSSNTQLILKNANKGKIGNKVLTGAIIYYEPHKFHYLD